MSNLISQNQRSTAQEPEVVKQPPIPKPPRRLQEFDLQPTFEQGLDPSNQLAGLEIATEEQMQTDTLEVGDSTAPGVVGGESEVGLTRYLGGQLGESLPVQLPNVPAASTPPMTSLWKDATVDLGVPNLADARLVTTAFPTAYSDPLTIGFDPGVGQTFGAGVQANAVADAQANAQRTAAFAKAAQDFQNARGNLPNTPDASKPWHEQLWGWAGDVLQGTEQERATEERTGKGTFGAYGSGLGGFFKSVFGVPIAAATATYLETWGRDEYRMQGRLLRAGNPTVRTERVTKEGKRMSVEVPYNSLSAEEKHKYLTEVVSNRLPLGTGNLVRTNVDFRRAFGSYIYDAFAGNVNDSINEANPNLAPVRDRRTGKLAQVKQPRGLLRSANLRPGQEWYEDPAGSALEIATQLFSPGNKVDAAGELLGLGLRSIAKTNAAQQAGRAIVNAVPQSVKKGASAVVGAGKRTVQAIKQGNFGSTSVAPISQPTPVVGVGKNQIGQWNRQQLQNYSNNQANISANSNAPTRILQPAVDPDVETGLQAWRNRHSFSNQPLQWKAPVLPNVPAFNPTQTPFAPKTDPEGLAAVVGIGQKGQPLAFEPTVGLRTHQELVEQVLNNNPEKFGSYKGTTWAEWNEWKKANLSEEDLRQLEAVGAFEVKTKLQSDTTLQHATLDDLQTQARVLAEQKLSVEAPLKQLEETFDDLVDVGRREIDELPLRPLTEADLQKATDYGSSVRLSRQLPPSVVEAAAKGNWQAVWTQAEAMGGMQTLLQTHNTRLQDLSPTVLQPATTRLATDAPTTVYHGTALENWSPDYSFSEFGSRGELGSGLYTTSSLEEAEYYARATVSNSRSVEIAYEPLSPQVVELDTSQLQAPLDARLPLATSDELVEAVVENLPSSVKQQLDTLDDSLSFAELVAKTEVAAAKAGGSEELLRQVSDSTADTLREFGYDSVYDSKSGWLSVVDNGKLQPTKATPLPEPTAAEAAVARYNADSIAAGHFSDNVTSDANLRDSTYQLLDTARNQLDERLEEVQAQLAEATYKEEPPTPAATAKAQSFDELRARAKEPPSVERYVRDIQEFGQPLHPIVVRATKVDEFEVIGNFEAYEAALQSYNPRTYSTVSAIVLPGEAKAKLSDASGYKLVDILSLRKGKAIPLPSTKEEIIQQFKELGYTTSPAVLERTSFESYRVLDRGATANAYSSLYKKGERNAEMVPSMVVGRDGTVDFKLVDLSDIEKKAKALEPEVPKLEEITKEQRRRETILEALRIRTADEDVETMLNAVRREEQWVKEATAEEAEEAAEALTNANLGYQVTYLQKSSAFEPNLKQTQTRASAVLEQVKLKRQAKGKDKRSTTIRENLRVSEQETTRLLSDAQAVVDNPDDLSIAKRFEGSLLLYEKKVAEVPGAKAVEPEIPNISSTYNLEELAQKLFSDYSESDSLKLAKQLLDEELLSGVSKDGFTIEDIRLPENFSVPDFVYTNARIQKRSRSNVSLATEPKVQTEVEKPLADLSMKELRELGNSLGVKGNSKQKLIERIQEAQAKARAPKWAGLSPDRAKVLNKRLQTPPKPSIVESIVVEPPQPKQLQTKLKNHFREPQEEIRSFVVDELQYKPTPTTSPVVSADVLSLARELVKIGSDGANKGWSMQAQSAGARLAQGQVYLEQGIGSSFFDFSQDIVAYANQILRGDGRLAYVHVSQDLGQDVADALLSTAKAAVEKLAKEEPEQVAKIVKQMGRKSVEYKTNLFARYADALTKGKTFDDLQKAIDEFRSFSKTKEYEQTPRPEYVDYGKYTEEDYSAELWDDNKRKAIARNFSGDFDEQYRGDNPYIGQTTEYSPSTFDEMSAVEEQARWNSFSEPVQPNPHASLREALDSTVDDSPNICKF